MDLEQYLDRLKESLPENISERLSVTQLKSYLFIGGALLCAVLYVLLLIMPQVGNMRDMRQGAEEIRSRKLLDQKRIERLEEFLSKRNELKSEWRELSRGLPQAREIPQFLEELSGIARNSKVQIISIRPVPAGRDVARPRPVEEYYRPIPIEIAAKSGFHQLGAFISDLEAGERVITIEKLTIRRNDMSPRLHDVNMVIRTYAAVGGSDE